MGLADVHRQGMSCRRPVLGAVCLLLLAGDVLGLLAPVASAADAPLAASDYKMAGDATKMRIVMNFDREPDIKWFLLRGPQSSGHRSAEHADSPSTPRT